MSAEKNKYNNTTNNLLISEQEYNFRVILKFWKKESKNTSISLPLNQCNNIENFINALKQKFEIKRYHCLEEIWVLQVRSPQEMPMSWIKETNGRLKLHVSDAIKELLMRRGMENGTRDFEDPCYDYEE